MYTEAEVTQEYWNTYVHLYTFTCTYVHVYTGACVYIYMYMYIQGQKLTLQPAVARVARLQGTRANQVSTIETTCVNQVQKVSLFSHWS